MKRSWKREENQTCGMKGLAHLDKYFQVINISPLCIDQLGERIIPTHSLLQATFCSHILSVCSETLIQVRFEWHLRGVQKQ